MKFGTAIKSWKLWSPGAVAFFIGLSIAYRDLRVTSYDDAAITYRYAWNISHGLGWVYNQGDRTNGASSPLYTFLLAIGSKAGFQIPGFSVFVNVTSYALVGLLIYLITENISQLIPSKNFLIQAVPLLSVCLFYLSEGARSIFLSGMETSFCSLLGLLSIYFVVKEQVGFAWFIAGLAVVAKIDALALVCALGMLQYLLHKPNFKEIIRILKFFIIAPFIWFTFSQFYFGSIIPNSANQKFFGLLTQNFKFDHSWVLKHLASDGYFIATISCISIAIIFFITRFQVKFFFVAMAIFVWPMIHGTFFSVVNLGGLYDWYLGVLYPPLLIVTGLFFIYTLNSLETYLKKTTIYLIAGICIFTTVFAGHNLKQTLSVINHGHQVSDYEAFEKTRQEAGEWLGKQASSREVVATCFGWIAWGAIQNPIQETCPLSTRKSVGSPNWFVNSSFPGVRIPKGAEYGGQIKKQYVSNQGGRGATWIVRLPTNN